MENNNSNGNKNGSFFSKNKTTLIGIAVAGVVVVASVSAYFVSVNSKVKSWDEIVYPGVHAYGVDLGGKTKSEAVEILNTNLIQLIHDKKIEVKVGDKDFNLSYADIDSKLDAEKAADAAVAYGKDGGVFDKNKIIKNGGDYSVDVDLAYDESKLHEFEDKVNNDIKVDPTNANISISYGNINITPEVVGKQIDKDELHSKLVEKINADPNSTEVVEIGVKDAVPEITAEKLGKITGTIASYTGSYTNAGGAGRVTNMQLATGFINGTLLMPGDEFSYNNTIGDTTAERGYQLANTYVGDQVVPGYGGGVCQISTFLYRTAMKANLRSTVRYNHSMMVGYSEPSLDATVAEGDIDYRFKNTYNTPIYIEGYMGGGAITFNIYGSTEEKGNKTYALTNQVLEKYDFSTRYIDDASLAQGTNQVKINGAAGYKSLGILITYEDGVEVNREQVSTDVYQPMDTIMQRGTKKVEVSNNTGNNNDSDNDNSDNNS